MDKLLQNPIFLKVFALMLTIILFFLISPTYNENTSNSILSSRGRAVIENVPLEIIYDTENYVVSGAPSAISVTISGPKSLVISAENLRDFKAEIRLKDPPVGTQKVPITLKNLSDKLTAKATPREVSINVQEKIEKNYSAIPDFRNIILEKGFTISKSSINPESVLVTGGKDTMNKVSKVLAVAPEKAEVTSNFKVVAKLIAIDAKGTALDVQITPEQVEIDASVRAPSKQVPLVPSVFGQVSSGVDLANISLNPLTITVYGTEKELKNITEFKVPINLKGITKTTELSIPLEIPPKLMDISLKEVTATITVTDKNSQTFNNIKVIPVGLNESKFTLEFLNGDAVTIIFSGDPELLSTLANTELSPTIDVSRLEAGEHQVPVEIDGPDDITYTFSPPNLSIAIYNKQ